MLCQAYLWLMRVMEKPRAMYIQLSTYQTTDSKAIIAQYNKSPLVQKKYIYMTCNYVNFLQNKQHQQINNTRNEQIGEIKWHFRATIRNKSPESLNEKKLNE